MIKLHLAWKFKTNLFVGDYKKRAFCVIVLPKWIMILGGGVMIILRKQRGGSWNKKGEGLNDWYLGGKEMLNNIVQLG